MAHVDMENHTHKLLIEANRNVRAYADSDASKHAIELLDALMASYCVDLIHVSPDGLIRLQAALQQVTALRDTFANDGMNIPKI
jgi:hypothetical protein